jgi:MFS family permease
MATVDQSAAVAAAAASPAKRISTGRQIAINLFWFANNFHWIALISVVIPAQVAVYFGDANKSINLAAVVVGGTFAAFIVNPLTGSLSDYVKLKIGRRRPFMIGGTIVNVLALVAFAFEGQTFVTTPFSVPSITTMALLFLALQISNNFANAPWSAIIADQVPAVQRGSASGWFGIMTLLGTIAGFLFSGSIVHYGTGTVDKAVFAHEIFIFYLALAAVQAVFVLITVLTVHETLPANVPTFTWGDFLKRFRLESRRYPDFTWVLLTRVLVMTGIWSINNFLVYYFADVLHRQNATGDVSGAFFPIVLGTSLITTFLGGNLSDKVGRKPLVYLSGAMMTLTCLLFILVPLLTTNLATLFLAALIAAGFFGLGYGAYTSVDWALATDVLPPTDQYGKDMGIWSAAGIIPQVIGVTLGGVIINTLRSNGGDKNLGYSVLFGIAVLLFGLGTLLVSRVKGAR